MWRRSSLIILIFLQLNCNENADHQEIHKQNPLLYSILSPLFQSKTHRGSKRNFTQLGQENNVQDCGDVQCLGGNTGPLWSGLAPVKGTRPCRQDCSHQVPSQRHWGPGHSLAAILKCRGATACQYSTHLNTVVVIRVI